MLVGYSVNLGFGSVSELECCFDGGKIIVENGKVSGVGGDGGVTTERNTEVGLCECRCIICAVTDHRDGSLALEPAYRRGFSCRRNVREDVVDRWMGKSIGCSIVVAGEHDDRASTIPEALQRRLPVRSRFVTECDHARRSLISADEDLTSNKLAANTKIVIRK